MSASPNLVCDLVLKGGITSGILYPPAIDEIRQRFTLSGIGGTSAGAIAAGMAAAAELRRRRGSDEGYRLLAEIPGLIGGEGKLLELFRPDAKTTGLFATFLRAIEKKEDRGLFGKARLYFDFARLLLSDAALAPLSENEHGLCTGMANGVSLPPGSMPALTRWLSERMDTIAGMPEGRPLTFGDLWSAPVPDHLKSTMTGHQSIQLQLVSTCLSFGRPYVLPNLDNRFAFSPQELLSYFPGYVVDYLIAEGNKIRKPPEMPAHLLPLPTRDKLPVILGVRMSLSFPVLFSLVPLYHPDYRAEPVRYERVYFADGGITSNLPIHFFDSPFPRWPTLAINLQYSKEAGKPDRLNVDEAGVWMTRSASDGTLELFNRFLGAKSPLGQLFGVGGAVFRSAQTWTDNSYLTLPGFRDRIAEVWLDPHEGGMNLTMPPAVIAGLAAKGRAAGKRLVSRFADVQPKGVPDWDGHRWTRFRASMAAVARYSRAWRESVAHPMPGDASLVDLFAKATDLPYALGGVQLREVIAATEAFERFAYSLDAASPPGADAKDPGARPFHDGPRPPLTLQGRGSVI